MSGWEMNDLEPQEKKVEVKRPVPEVQGFNLSQDYELLWKLICNGYRVPGWVIYRSNAIDHTCWDIVEIVKRDHKDVKYLIGTRGIGYNTFCGADDQIPEKSFIEDCTHFNLWYAMPNCKIPLL